MAVLYRGYPFSFEECSFIRKRYSYKLLHILIGLYCCMFQPVISLVCYGFSFGKLVNGVDDRLEGSVLFFDPYIYLR